MKIKKAVPVFIISMLVITALFNITGRATHAQGSDTSESSVLEKLDEITSNQKLIMAELASLKEEIKIVKIRVTQSQ